MELGTADDDEYGSEESELRERAELETTTKEKLRSQNQLEQEVDHAIEVLEKLKLDVQMAQ